MCGIGGGTHGQNTGRMLEAIEAVLLKEMPNAVLVYGDTASTLAGALVAVKLHIPVAHVEAGLRSFNRRMPEEINRILTDHVSEILFAPTEIAVQNLLKEGIPKGRIHFVGDVMYDAALFYAKKAERKSRVLDELKLGPKGYILATIHRAENTDDPHRLRVILEALAEVHSHLPVVLPVHPRTRQRAERFGLAHLLTRILAIEPLGYLDMVLLEKNARVLVTDSGGVQKEAFFHEVSCVTLREETEWVELVTSGWNVLCPRRDKDLLAKNILSSDGRRGQPMEAYGEGKAGMHIAKFLRRWLGN